MQAFYKINFFCQIDIKKSVNKNNTDAIKLDKNTQNHF